MQVVLSERAEFDLFRIYQYIDERSHDAADAFCEGSTRTSTTWLYSPSSGGIVPALPVVSVASSSGST
jgi:hypothetical protein